MDQNSRSAAEPKMDPDAKRESQPPRHPWYIDDRGDLVPDLKDILGSIEVVVSLDDRPDLSEIFKDTSKDEIWQIPAEKLKANKVTRKLMMEAHRLCTETPPEPLWKKLFRDPIPDPCPPHTWPDYIVLTNKRIRATPNLTDPKKPRLPTKLIQIVNAKPEQPVAVESHAALHDNEDVDVVLQMRPNFEPKLQQRAKNWARETISSMEALEQARGLDSSLRLWKEWEEEVRDRIKGVPQPLPMVVLPQRPHPDKAFYLPASYAELATISPPLKTTLNDGSTRPDRLGTYFVLSPQVDPFSPGLLDEFDERPFPPLTPSSKASATPGSIRMRGSLVECVSSQKRRRTLRSWEYGLEPDMVIKPNSLLTPKIEQRIDDGGRGYSSPSMHTPTRPGKRRSTPLIQSPASKLPKTSLSRPRSDERVGFSNPSAVAALPSMSNRSNGHVQTCELPETLSQLFPSWNYDMLEPSVTTMKRPELFASAPDPQMISEWAKCDPSLPIASTRTVGGVVYPKDTGIGSWQPGDWQGSQSPAPSPHLPSFEHFVDDPGYPMNVRETTYDVASPYNDLQMPDLLDSDIAWHDEVYVPEGVVRPTGSNNDPSDAFVDENLEKVPAAGFPTEDEPHSWPITYVPVSRSNNSKTHVTLFMDRSLNDIIHQRSSKDTAKDGETSSYQNTLEGFLQLVNKPKLADRSSRDQEPPKKPPPSLPLPPNPTKAKGEDHSWTEDSLLRNPSWTLKIPATTKHKLHKVPILAHIDVFNHRSFVAALEKNEFDMIDREDTMQGANLVLSPTIGVILCSLGDLPDKSQDLLDIVKVAAVHYRRVLVVLDSLSPPEIAQAGDGGEDLDSAGLVGPLTPSVAHALPGFKRSISASMKQGYNDVIGEREILFIKDGGKEIAAALRCLLEREMQEFTKMGGYPSESLQSRKWLNSDKHADTDSLVDYLMVNTCAAEYMLHVAGSFQRLVYRMTDEDRMETFALVIGNEVVTRFNQRLYKQVQAMNTSEEARPWSDGADGVGPDLGRTSSEP